MQVFEGEGGIVIREPETGQSVFVSEVQLGGLINQLSAYQLDFDVKRRERIEKWKAEWNPDKGIINDAGLYSEDT